MFESVLLESGNRIQTKSRYWMFATTTFNAAVVAAIVLIPMLYPEALPRSVVSATLQPPPLPHAVPARAPAQPVHAVHTVARLNPIVAPSQIPDGIRHPKNDEAPQTATGVQMFYGHPDSADEGVPFTMASFSTPPLVTVKPKKPTMQRVSAGVIAGMAVSKTQPVYPTIAQAAKVSGTVELHAIISKTGTIENLSVLDGPEMLRRAALDAVKTWRYRPYLLNGEPVEVDTTISVRFTLGS